MVASLHHRCSLTLCLIFICDLICLLSIISCFIVFVDVVESNEVNIVYENDLDGEEMVGMEGIDVEYKDIARYFEERNIVLEEDAKLDVAKDPFEDQRYYFLHPDSPRPLFKTFLPLLRPLTIEELNICRESYQYQLPAAMKCSIPSGYDLTEEDKAAFYSCLKCYHFAAMKFKDLSDAYKKEEFKTERIGIAKKLIEDSKLNEIILIAVNYGQLFLFYNWACSLQHALGIDARKITIVVPTDKDTYKHLRRSGFAAYPVSFLKHLEFEDDSSYHGRSNVGGHADINNILMIAAVELIEANITVLMQDADLVWVKDPRAYLRSATFRRDLVAAPSRRWDSKGPMNSGFIYIKPTRVSKIFLKTLENMCAIKEQSDQLLWNTALRQRQFTQVQWRTLPEELFPTGIRDPSQSQLPLRSYEHAFIFHPVSSSKVEKLKSVGQYYFTREICPKFYDSQLPTGG